MKSILAGLMLLASATAAHSKTIILYERPGGFVKLHLDVADRWIRDRKRIVLAGDQWSAAALQVAYFASRRPNMICARKGVRLYYHDGPGWLVRTPRFVGIKDCR